MSRTFVLLVGAFAAAASSGCVGAPMRFSARSAASPEATSAPSVVVARALREEPPLPGESTEGWPGLAAPTSGGMHAHHHHPPAPAASGEEAHHAQ